MLDQPPKGNLGETGTMFGDEPTNSERDKLKALAIKQAREHNEKKAHEVLEERIAELAKQQGLVIGEDDKDSKRIDHPSGSREQLVYIHALQNELLKKVKAKLVQGDHEEAREYVYLVENLQDILRNKLDCFDKYNNAVRFTPAAKND